MANQIPPTVHIKANGFPEAWYKAIRECLNNGAIKWRDYGGPVETRDVISLIEINNPIQEPVIDMLHPDFPTKELHLKEYIKQFERGYDWKAQGFEYSYIDRLVNYPTTDVTSRPDGYYKISRKPTTQTIDQIKVISEKIANRIKKGGKCLVSNRDSVVTWVPERDLLVDDDQPCLQRIQFFIYSFPTIGDNGTIIPGKGEFHVDWRSRDLYSAWNSNLVAITLFLKREIFDPNNIKIIRCIDHCSSLHIYYADWESASKVKAVLKSPQMIM